MENQLVAIENNTPFTTSYIIAGKLGVKHRSIMQLIKDHLPKIEKHFGHVRFENADGYRPQGGGQSEQYAILTENQAHYILTLSRNTDEAMEVKALFVKAFDEAKQQLLNRQTEMLALSEQLAQLEKRLHALPPGLSAAQVDLADMATSRIYQSLTRNLSHLGILYSRHKITDDEFQKALDAIKELIEPMGELRSIIGQELALEKDLTYILFDYRGVLKTLNPDYQLMSGDTPKQIKGPEENDDD